MGLSAAIAGVGAALSAAGTIVSYNASNAASNAANTANEQTILSQNTAFNAREAAKRAQTAEQAGIQDASQATYLAEEQSMRDQQNKALSERQAAIDKMNAQSQAIQDETTRQVQDTTQNKVTAQTLADAQAASEAQRNAAVTPVVEDIKASNPIVTPTAGSDTKSAMAKAMSDAAANTQKYGQRLATLGSYSAPTTTAGLETTRLGTNLMPAKMADRLLSSGVSNLLLPSSTAYQNATTYGKAAIDANTQNTADQMTVAKQRATNATDLANLQQSNESSLIQTGLNFAQARAASQKALGSGLSSLGNAALLGGASMGAGAALSGVADNIYSGLGNLFNGYSWSGMATGSNLSNLAGQAAGNIAGGAAL